MVGCRPHCCRRRRRPRPPPRRAAGRYRLNQTYSASAPIRITARSAIAASGMPIRRRRRRCLNAIVPRLRLAAGERAVLQMSVPG
jgi:hypothetical protein